MARRFGTIPVILVVLVVVEYTGLTQAQGVPFCVVPGNECLNGGHCVKAGDGYQSFCACKKPFYGVRCEYEEPEDPFCKVPNQCGAYGKCIKGGDGIPAFCLCFNRYKGKNCEIPPDTFCSKPNVCKNGGQCIEGGDNHPAFCSCPDGFRGTYCESRGEEFSTSA